MVTKVGQTVTTIYICVNSGIDEVNSERLRQSR